MPHGPQKLILINAGRYNFAEIDLSGSVQIVGPNNTGKTTLINTLQFLYLDDRRHMDFGSYSAEQTRDYYFPGQYSYILFQCLGARGQCVFGWRGEARAAGGEPERFLFDGPFDPADFLDENNQVREPKAVAARLAPRNFTLIRSAQDHRELLLLPTKGESRGLGLVALKDNDRYSHFRETLKNLLSLSTISQDQMRDRLLMLAGLPSDKPALDVRDLFGDAYERILRLKDRFLRFKAAHGQISQLIDTFSRRSLLGRELEFRWADLRGRRDAFVQQHHTRLESLAADAADALAQANSLGAEIDERRREERELSESRGNALGAIRRIRDQVNRFADFVEPLERTAIENRDASIRSRERQLADAEGASRDQTESRLDSLRAVATRHRSAIQHLDRALVTVLRRDLSDAELAPLIALFNPEILQLPVGDDGVRILDRSLLIASLRAVAARIHNQQYSDPAISLPLRVSPDLLAELADPDVLRRRLAETEDEIRRWESILHAISQREQLTTQLNKLRSEQESARKRLFEWEQACHEAAELPRLEADLRNTDAAIESVAARIRDLETRAAAERRRKDAADQEASECRRSHDSAMARFSACRRPDLSGDPLAPNDPIPDRFDDAVTLFLNAQDLADSLGAEVERYRFQVESALGGDYAGADVAETVRNLREEIEALPEREEALRRSWEQHLTSVRAKFHEILKDLTEIQTAAAGLNRALAAVQVSNLAALRLEVVEQPDIVGAFRKLANVEQPGLFEDSSGLDAALASFKQRFESNPLLRYSDLFILRFTVTGDDGRPHHYNDFRQVESHGTTITIKVLFNLIVLRALLREDSSRSLLCEVPFFLDEIHSLDAVNRHAILSTARRLGFIAITAAPESVSEVASLYFLQPHQGRIVLRQPHRIGVKSLRP